jgi:hypothetical protein
MKNETDKVIHKNSGPYFDAYAHGREDTTPIKRWAFFKLNGQVRSRKTVSRQVGVCLWHLWCGSQWLTVAAIPNIFLYAERHYRARFLDFAK